MTQKSFYYLWLAIFVAVSTLAAPAFADDGGGIQQQQPGQEQGQQTQAPQQQGRAKRFKTWFWKQLGYGPNAQPIVPRVLQPTTQPEANAKKPADTGEGINSINNGENKTNEFNLRNTNQGEGVVEKVSPEEALERFTTNMTEAAKQGKYAKYVGRTSDLKRGEEVLWKAGNKAAWIVGEPGAGKSAYVEALAGNLPDGYEIFRLDLSILEAGTGYKGIIQSRVMALVEGIKSSNGKKILFIDEVHVAMRSKEFIDYIKPLMARGEMSFIGATTWDEFRDIEKDPAFKERGDLLEIRSPSMNEVLTNLRLLRDKLEAKHGVKVDDLAMRRAAEHAFRYYPFSSPHRMSQTILDRTMSRIATETKYGSYELLDLQDQREALEYEKNSLEKDIERIYSQHEEQKEIHNKRIAEIDLEIRKINGRMEDIRKSESFEDLEKRLTDMKEEVKKLKSGNDMLRRAELQNSIKDLETKLGGLNPKGVKAITERQVARTVSLMRDIPIDFILQTSMEKLDKMEKYMNSRVLNSNRQIRLLKDALAIKMANVIPVEGAAIVMMLAGPTGAGKSEFVKALAMGLFGTQDAVIRIDGNEFKLREAITKMVGSGPGYVDSDKGGAITEQIRRKPFSVVAIEEFDKMHIDTIRYWMEAWDNGFMKDGYGRKIDCRNTMFVITTNIGQQFALFKAKIEKDFGKDWVNNREAINEIETKFGQKQGSLWGMTEFEMDLKILEFEMLNREMPVPLEIINRLTVQVLAKAITFADANEIAKKLVEYMKEHTFKEHGIKLEVTEKAIEAITKMTFEEAYGARPVKRGRDATLGKIMAEMVLKHHVRKGETVKIDFTENASKNGGQLIGETGAKLKLTSDVDITYRMSFRPGDPAMAAGKAGGEVGKPAPENAMEALAERMQRVMRKGK